MQEQIPRLRSGHAHRERPELPKEIQRLENFGQSQGQKPIGQSVGAGQQVEVLRESSRLVEREFDGQEQFLMVICDNLFRG